MEQDFDNDLIDFPALFSYNENDDLVIPPQATRLRELMEAKSSISDCKFYGQFRDDGLPCYNLSITVGVEEIKFSIWCMEDVSLLFSMARAPFVSEDHKRVVEYLLSETDPNRE